MYLVAESVYDGTWSGQGAAPQELADFELMLGMHWSWEQLEATPRYVRRFCTDMLALRRQAEARRAKQRG